MVPFVNSMVPVPTTERSVCVSASLMKNGVPPLVVVAASHDPDIEGISGPLESPHAPAPNAINSRTAPAKLRRIVRPRRPVRLFPSPSPCHTFRVSFVYPSAPVRSPQAIGEPIHPLLPHLY